MKRTWLRWALLTVFIVALSFTFVSLGNWQLDRLDQRRDRNATVVAHDQAPPQPFDAVFTKPITEADQWQRVLVRGRFIADRQLQVRHRSFERDTGWEVVTPLVTDSGRTVLVDRGFIARPPSQDYPRTFPAPPPGEVELVGYTRRNEQGPEQGMRPTENTVRLVNSDAIAPWLGRDLVNGYVSLITVDPAQTDELRPLTPPPQDEGPHWSYAMQWFAFTVIAGVGLIVLIRNDLADKKKAEQKRARVTRTAATPPEAAPTEEVNDATRTH